MLPKKSAKQAVFNVVVQNAKNYRDLQGYFVPIIPLFAAA
jgi:hypothetical protein